MSSAEAVTAFALGRRADPAAARELLEAQWSTVSAKVRADAVRALGPGLSAADEPLLERALDDRAKSVREAAAAMLDRLPGSARAARMADRLRRLVRVRGTLVRHLEVEVPDAPDEAAVRDGLTAPAKGVDPTPTVWLSQVVRGAPLSTWTDITGRGPSATLRMVRDADVLAWLTEAVLDRRDTEWAVACVDHGIPDHRLLWLLPEERRARLLADWVGQRTGGRDLRQLLTRAPRPWPDDLGRAVLEADPGREGRPVAGPRRRSAPAGRTGPRAGARDQRRALPPARGRRPPAPRPDRDPAAPRVPHVPDGGLQMTTTQPTPDVLRQHAEDAYADELAALAAVDDRPRPPSWQLSPGRWRPTSSAASSPDGTAITPKYVGSAPAGRGRDRHAGHRPGAAAARRARHRQDVGRRAPRRRDQRPLDPGRAGHGRHPGGGAALRLELRPPARRGPVRGRRSCRAR